MAVEADPRKLLIPDPDYIPSFFQNKIWALTGALFGSSTILLLRISQRRPVWSGLPKYVYSTALCALLGHYIDGLYKDYYSEQEARLRHYLEVHPEDFPMPERKKVGELFEPWTPVR